MCAEYRPNDKCEQGKRLFRRWELIAQFVNKPGFYDLPQKAQETLTGCQSEASTEYQAHVKGCKKL